MSALSDKMEMLQAWRQAQNQAQTQALAAAAAAASQASNTADDVCKICESGARSHAAAPCGHKHFCSDCASRLEETRAQCPVCHQDIGLTVRIFE